MKKNLKRALAVLITALVLLAVPLNGARADIYYSGEVDPTTNEPIASGAETTETGSRVIITSTMSYDRSSRSYVFPVGEGIGEVYASVPDGAVVSVPVKITAANGVSLVVYRDGNEYSGGLDNVATAGEYVVSARQGDTPTRLFSFILVGERTNRLTQFSAPDGFYIASVTRDGESIFGDRYNVSLSQEGLYDIQCDCMTTDLTCSLRTTVDRTPPTITLEGERDDQGRFRSAVTFSGMEEGGSVVLTRGETAVQPTLDKVKGTGTIVDSGLYRLQVYDAAGNRAETDITILMYFNANSLIFFALVVAVAVAVVAYIVLKRRNLKIG